MEIHPTMIGEVDIMDKATVMETDGETEKQDPPTGGMIKLPESRKGDLRANAVIHGIYFRETFMEGMQCLKMCRLNLL